MVETDRLFVDHTELNLPERLFYPAISDPSTKIGRNKMHNFVDLNPRANIVSLYFFILGNFFFH